MSANANHTPGPRRICQPTIKIRRDQDFGTDIYAGKGKQSECVEDFIQASVRDGQSERLFVTKRCERLLAKAFIGTNVNGDRKVVYSGVDTSEGCYLDWMRLQAGGLVKMRPAFLHAFSAVLTPEGKALMETIAKGII